MKLVVLYLFGLAYFFLGHVSAQNTATVGTQQCARQPSFMGDVGITQPAAIDTTIARLPGLVIRELRSKKRLYQHPSWRQTGHVGPTVRDASGNIYVIPIPSVALDTNPLERRNRIYKVDSVSGEMNLFVELPLPDESKQQNPFGTLGITLDCDTNSLYVSSVAGSTPRKIAGTIYQIDIKTAKIIGQYDGVDSIGLGLYRHRKHKRLYFGDARSSNLYSIPLLENGGFNSTLKPRYELSLLNIKNGDSTQVRKIKFNTSENGDPELQVDETDFSFRMSASTSRRYRTYFFTFDGVKSEWELSIIRP